MVPSSFCVIPREGVESSRTVSKSFDLNLPKPVIPREGVESHSLLARQFKNSLSVIPREGVESRIIARFNHLRDDFSDPERGS